MTFIILPCTLRTSDVAYLGIASLPHEEHIGAGVYMRVNLALVAIVMTSGLRIKFWTQNYTTVQSQLGRDERLYLKI